MSKKDVSDPPDDTSEKFPIVALCASAGGLDAFQAFFDAMPSNSGMAFIVVQHLASQQESILHELIQQHTRIAVHPISDEMLVEPNNIYVLPAGHELHIWNKHLRLTPREQIKGWPRTIDQFLTSLAHGQGRWATAIILSGVGRDGVEGSRAIKQAGGAILVQDASAAQQGMPTSVIDAGLADDILKPEQMPDVLLSHFKIDIHKTLQLEDLSEQITEEDIDQVILCLQRLTEHNFADYKRSTLRRQIARRMGMYQFSTSEAYLDYINKKPDEAEQLTKHLLINVTGFFRDAESFEALKEKALMPAIAKMNIDRIFRAWVPGCASGEEAVSIAILIYECLQELNMREMEVRIFATDVNHDILQRPRLGLYPHTIAQEVRADRLKDHFILEENGYRVRAHISRMIIWAEHNLVEHPPFSSLHLISCRNVLIYFQKRLQDRTLALFQFALQTDGILFLGSSETMPHEMEAFAPIDSKHKIFQRTANNKRLWLRLDQPLFISMPDFTEAIMPEPQLPKHERDDIELDIIKNVLVEHYESTCVLVDEQYLVRYTFGEIDRYLRIVPGRGQNNILDMARPGLDVELTIALHQAFDGDEKITRQGVWVKTNGDERIINLIVYPIKHAALSGRQRLVIFELAVNGNNLYDRESQLRDSEEGATISRLRGELLETQKALQNVTQALQAKSEELTSSMEEIRSANEEIQTTNEELRTSKEELESMNEELNTLNTQLTDQNFELSHANNTLHNFLQSADVGIIFLNQDLLIQEYTTAVTDIFRLRPGDKGRPLMEIANQLVYDNLISDAEDVLDTLKVVEREVVTTDGHWYNLRIRPYRTTNNVIDGLVLTFADITAQKRAQAVVEQRNTYTKQIFDTIDNGIIELDRDLRVMIANKTFYDLFETTEKETVGQFLYSLGNGQWDIPDLRHLLSEVIPEQNVVHNYLVTHNFPQLGKRTMRLNARQIAEVDRILLVITDISDKAD